VATWDLFSKREARKQKQGIEDVFQYDLLPKPFRVQVFHIWGDALAAWHTPAAHYDDPMNYEPNMWWSEIEKVIKREKGLLALTKNRSNPHEQCVSYLMEAETENALDMIEVSFHMLDRHVRNLHVVVRNRWNLTSADDAIAELNQRFREHGIGYEYRGGQIIRVDSKYIHAEAVRPALRLLHDEGKSFAGPLQEFMKAHEFHRKGEDKDAISWALKAFESTMKAICTARSWPFDSQKDTASDLVKILFANDLVPSYLQNHVSALRTVLESGVPTVRNKTSGHGQGPTPVAVPPHYSAYALHMTASCIVFLMECHKAMK